MSTYGTVIQSGTITATGQAIFLPIRSDIDWMKVLNITEAHASNNGHGFEYYWQRGMTIGTGVMHYHPAGDHTMAIDTTATGFTLYDDSTWPLGAAIAVTNSTNATRPVYTVASTAGLLDRAVVRISSTAHTNLNGLDFTIDDIDNGGTNFRLANTLATAPGVVSGAGFYRLVTPNINRGSLWYPKRRNIANITQANPGVVTTLVDHLYTTGEQVRFTVPAVYGMTQLDGITATITVLTASTFSIGIDTTAYTAFNFPLPAIAPFNLAQVMPIGEGSGSAYSGLKDDESINRGELGMYLAAGTTGPAGSTSDVLYWIAGKSVNL